MADKKKKKTCYYEVLGVDRKCDVAEIKASYRKLALKMHPDKARNNGLTVEEATQQFQVIQEAYSVLSDAQERAWYDAHREQILKGDDECGEDPFKTKINLYKYFSTSCYDGFGDKAGSFFAVYADLFVAINTEEEEWEDKDSSDEDRAPMPPFGSSTSEWADVSNFYKHWLDFCSRKAFGHADKWNPREAENRQVRRAMEQENKKARQAAKKEFNAEVRQLVRFVQKRDPRVAAHQKQQAKESAERAQREQAEKERKKAAEVATRQQRKEAQRREEEERWKEVQAAKEARRARGEVVSDDEDESEEEELVEYSCEACRKTFKSEKAFDSHTKSKKHQQAVAAFRKQMERELREEAEREAAAVEEEEDDSDDDIDLEAQVIKQAVAATSSSAPAFCPPTRTAGASGKSAVASPKADESDDDDDDDDDEDAFLARFAAGTKGRAKARPKAAAPEKDDEGVPGAAAGTTSVEAVDEVDSESQEDLTTTGSKKANKKAKQKALLLEKSREREHVQELVKNAKKSEKKAEGVANGVGTEDAAVESVDLPPGQNGTDARCAVCGEVFPSRTKMFQHIKATGHAALKEAPAPAAGAKGKKKKR